jgi:uncharacterized cupredoxin-like copper-binding protein
MAMNPLYTMLGAAAAALTVTGAGVATNMESGRSTAMSNVAVTLKEWKLVPNRKVVPPGPVTFTVANRGKLAHEFLVIKTGKAPSAIPVQGRAASEAGLVKEISEFKAGLTKTLTVTLPAGKYVLMCNIDGHYRAGQYAGIVVR